MDLYSLFFLLLRLFSLKHLCNIAITVFCNLSLLGKWQLFTEYQDFFFLNQNPFFFLLRNSWKNRTFFFTPPKILFISNFWVSIYLTCAVQQSFCVWSEMLLKGSPRGGAQVLCKNILHHKKKKLNYFLMFFFSSSFQMWLAAACLDLQ